MSYKVSETRDYRYRRRQGAAVIISRLQASEPAYANGYTSAQLAHYFVRIGFNKMFTERHTCKIHTRHFKMCPIK
jgi:hypothetical protein